ncbi:hypothetical protein [Candidatus Electronema sp. PJ]|uniref:hypothetical protein n=1 Tax=Candidatus Electronema sp. PJ TaxID=3401572 RepID=UPI003AA9B39E
MNTSRGSTEAQQPASYGMHSHISIILFLLAIFGLAVLCIGLGLTWFTVPLR